MTSIGSHTWSSCYWYRVIRYVRNGLMIPAELYGSIAFTKTGTFHMPHRLSLASYVVYALLAVILPISTSAVANERKSCIFHTVACALLCFFSVSEMMLPDISTFSSASFCLFCIRSERTNCTASTTALSDLGVVCHIDVRPHWSRMTGLLDDSTNVPYLNSRGYTLGKIGVRISPYCQKSLAPISGLYGHIRPLWSCAYLKMSYWSMGNTLDALLVHQQHGTRRALGGYLQTSAPCDVLMQMEQCSLNPFPSGSFTITTSVGGCGFWPRASAATATWAMTSFCFVLILITSAATISSWTASWSRTGP